MNRFAWYRRMRGFWISYGLHRLNGYGWYEALISMEAHRVCGHRMFWYPRAKREQIKRVSERDAIFKESHQVLGRR